MERHCNRIGFQTFDAAVVLAAVALDGVEDAKAVTHLH